jgi:hypothetical protein
LGLNWGLSSIGLQSRKLSTIGLPSEEPSSMELPPLWLGSEWSSFMGFPSWYYPPFDSLFRNFLYWATHYGATLYGTSSIAPLSMRSPFIDLLSYSFASIKPHSKRCTLITGMGGGSTLRWNDILCWFIVKIHIFILQIVQKPSASRLTSIRWSAVRWRERVSTKCTCSPWLRQLDQLLSSRSRWPANWPRQSAKSLKFNLWILPN